MHHASRREGKTLLSKDCPRAKVIAFEGLVDDMLDMPRLLGIFQTSRRLSSLSHDRSQGRGQALSRASLHGPSLIITIIIII